MEESFITFDIPTDILAATDMQNIFARKRLVRDCATEWHLSPKDLECMELEGEWKILVSGQSAIRLQDWLAAELTISLPEGVSIDPSDTVAVDLLLQDCAKQLGLQAEDLCLMADAETQELCVIPGGESLRRLQKDRLQP